MSSALFSVSSVAPLSKPNPSLWRHLRRFHEFAYRGHQLANRVVMPSHSPIKLRQARRQIPVRREHPTHSNKSTDDIDARLDGMLGTEDVGGHDGAVLGESVRQVAPAT